MTPIDELLEILDTIERDHGELEKERCTERVCDKMMIKRNSFRTNYETKRGYSDFKLKIALPFARGYKKMLDEKNSRIQA